MIAALGPLLVVSAIACQDDVPTRLAELVRMWRTDGAPGAALGVVRDGEPVLIECFGLAEIASDRPIDPDTPFYVASLAKPFTAALAMHAASNGAFDLDSKVTELFPELPPTYEAATLRQLLHHRSGIQDVYDLAIAADLGLAPVGSNAAILALLSRMPQLVFEPGTRMLYCNSGYVLLAEAIERGTGRALASYAREELFDPLGMANARYVGEPESTNAAKSYASEGDEWEEQRILTGLRGPGGLYLSLEDCVHFESAWARGEWGTPELRKDLVTAPGGWHHPRLGPYAAGWMLQELDGLRVERHPGGAFGFSADLQRFPDHSVSVIVLSNSSQIPAQELASSLARIVLADEIAAAKKQAAASVELSPEARARFGRIWRESFTGQVWILTPKPDHFVLATLGDLKLELVAVSETRLEARDSQVPFALEIAEGGSTVNYADGSTARLAAVPFPPRDLPPAESYAGEYVNEALGATLELVARDGQLVLVQHDALLEVPPFVALAPDLYVCDKGAQIDFRRDGEGRVAGLAISANRAWNPSFDRSAD